MTDGAADSRQRGRGRSLLEPAFPGDDGSADPRVRELLEAVTLGRTSTIDAARALRGIRLLAAVVAVTDEVDESGRDKSSHMAVVSMVNEHGRRGLLAFTGIDSLAAWDPAGRPVPALGSAAARAAIDDGAEGVVLDVAGPYPVVLTGPSLTALADGLDLGRVTALVEAALIPLTADGRVAVTVLDTRGAEPEFDVLVVVSRGPGGHPSGRAVGLLAEQAAGILTAREDIQRLVSGGIGVTAG